MKKITLTTLAIFTLSFIALELNAQASKVMAATNYLNDYLQSDKPNPENLISAKEAIDLASAHEKTSEQGKTWYTKGLIAITMYNDSSFIDFPDDFALETLSSFQKALDLNDKKFRDEKKLMQYALKLSTDVFNAGVDAYSKENFVRAYKSFTFMKNVNSFLKANKQDIAVETKVALSNAAQVAEQAGLTQEAILAYEDLLQYDNSVVNYRLLANLYKAENDFDKSLEVLEQAAETHPDDADVMIDQLNIFIGLDRLGEALEIIDKAIELQPDNDMLYYVKGTAYDGAGETDKAVIEYEKAVEINPENTRALYNAGAMYFNSANEYIEQMNELSLSEQKKYDELNKKRLDLYKKAKPFFERILEIEPEDDAAKRALTKINSSLK